ncbi:MAG: GNAT family N-acetyltransferase [Tannerella sp.]|jgi:ribosomal protein S18 acetylase RimI-like enzyme|nr:GNAT family N-acetyltransferase [Tannerella sp.]
MIKIEQVKDITPEIVEAFSILIPQLTAKNKIPDKKSLEEIIETKNTYLFIACAPHIVGSITVVVTNTPSGSKAWIEDVIVDKDACGQNTGEKLVSFAIDFIKGLNVSSINLTSSPDRIAANKLYRKLGFILRETNVYRLTI